MKFETGKLYKINGAIYTMIEWHPVPWNRDSTEDMPVLLGNDGKRIILINKQYALDYNAMKSVPGKVPMVLVVHGKIEEIVCDF